MGLGFDSGPAIWQGAARTADGRLIFIFLME
jgi:hypothetical protein